MCWSRQQVRKRAGGGFTFSDLTQRLPPTIILGMALFESIGCVHCHAGPNFSGASVFDGGAPYRAFPARQVAELGSLRLVEDPGRAARGSAVGVWRIP